MPAGLRRSTLSRRDALMLETTLPISDWMAALRAACFEAEASAAGSGGDEEGGGGDGCASADAGDASTGSGAADLFLPIDVIVCLLAWHCASRLTAAGELRARASRAASQIDFFGPVAGGPTLPIDFTTERSDAGDARRGASQIKPTASI